MVIEAGFDRVKLKSAVRLRNNISLSAKNLPQAVRS
jgi:hypothetical protein